MNDQAIRLFVYGTLKRGDVRAGFLNGQAFIRVAQTEPKYRLFNVGTYPALVEAQPIGVEGLAIQGELWEVDRACLARLDLEEGVDEGLYERRDVELCGLGRALAYFYLRSVEGLPDCGERWAATMGMDTAE